MSKLLTQMSPPNETVRNLFPPLREYIPWGIFMIIVRFIGINNFLLYYLLSIVYSTYMYLNFKDLIRLTHVTHGYDKEVPNIIKMIVLYIFVPFIPIAIYHKYKFFRIHLEKNHTEESDFPVSPWLPIIFLQIIPIILLIFMYYNTFISNSMFRYTQLYLILTYLIATVSAIIGFYYENNWQKLFNIHNLNHIRHLD